MDAELGKIVYSFADFNLVPLGEHHRIHAARCYRVNSRQDPNEAGMQYATKDRTKVLNSFGTHLVYCTASFSDRSAFHNAFPDVPRNDRDGVFDTRWNHTVSFEAATDSYPRNVAQDWTPEVMEFFAQMLNHRVMFWIGVESMKFVLASPDDKRMLEYVLEQKGVVSRWKDQNYTMRPDFWEMWT